MQTNRNLNVLFATDLGVTPEQFNREPQTYHTKYNAPERYPTDQVDAGDFSDVEESYPNTPRSSYYQQSNYSINRSLGSLSVPYDDGQIDARSGPSSSKGRASPVYDEPPREYPQSNSSGHRPRMEIPGSRGASLPSEPRSQSMDRDHVEPGYATIGDVMRSKSAERSSSTMPPPSRR